MPCFDYFTLPPIDDIIFHFRRRHFAATLDFRFISFRRLLMPFL